MVKHETFFPYFVRVVGRNSTSQRTSGTSPAPSIVGTKSTSSVGLLTALRLKWYAHIALHTFTELKVKRFDRVTEPTVINYASRSILTWRSLKVARGNANIAPRPVVIGLSVKALHVRKNFSLRPTSIGG